MKLARASELAKTQLAPALSRNEGSRDAGNALAATAAKRELGQRRYDWTPAAGEGAKPLEQTIRSRGPDRGR